MDAARQVDGILGTEFFSNFVVEIDYGSVSSMCTHHVVTNIKVNPLGYGQTIL
jgi:hypothetical protein